MEQNLREIYSANDLYKIKIIQEILEENNINSMVLDQKGSSLPFGEIHLYVDEKDEGEAKKIIADHDI